MLRLTHAPNLTMAALWVVALAAEGMVACGERGEGGFVQCWNCARLMPR